MNVEPIPQPILDDFFTFLRFASISTNPAFQQQTQECANWLLQKFRRMGLEAELGRTAGLPVVVARTEHDPTKPTLLFYGHYDVQPPEPIELWKSNPFEPTLQDNRVFARGSSDNKGQIFSHIAGLELLLQKGVDLPANVIFLIEGEEEIGSPSLPEFLRAHHRQLACDVVVVSDSSTVAHGYPTLAYSLRGITALECIVKGPAQELHSGVYGGAIQNPISAAARLIASFHQPDGRVAIRGFYDRVRPLEPWEREAAANLPISDKDILIQTGAQEFFGEPGFSAIERIGARPTAELNGIGGGYQGPGTKTVIPSEVIFKVTFRLVPDQEPQEILSLAEEHLRANCPPGISLQIQRGHSGNWFFSNPNTVYAQAARRALEDVFGKKPCLFREGGSIPILSDIRQIFGVDCLLLALASPDCNAHAPNENYPLENLARGIALHQALLTRILEVYSPRRGDFPAAKSPAKIC